MSTRQYSPSKYQLKSEKSSCMQESVVLTHSTVKRMQHNASSNQQSPFEQFSSLNANYSLTNEETVDLYRQKCFELEQEIGILKKDLEMQQLAAMKASNRNTELAESNCVLQGQAEKARKDVVQRRTEAEMWRQKYETQMSQMMQVKVNYESEIRLLQTEVQRVNARFGSLEAEKNRQISDEKAVSQCQQYQQVEAYRSSSALSAEVYEGQLKKLRDIIETKTALANQLQSQLERVSLESGDEKARFRSDMEALKNRMSSLQIDHQAELAALRSKLELYKETQARNAQFAHENQADMLAGEIGKLRQLLELKGQEIGTLTQQNGKLKASYMMELGTLRLENEEMKQRLLENESLFQQENYCIQTSLEGMHKKEMTSIKIQQEQLLVALNGENLKLKEIIDSRNEEIERQLVEKAQQKEYYNGEMSRLICTIEEQKKKLNQLATERSREVNDLLSRIERVNEQNEEIRRGMEKQLELLGQELGDLKMHLEDKNKQLESQMSVASKIKLDFEEKIRQLLDDIERLKLKSFEVEKARIQESQDLRLLQKDSEIQLKERIKSLEIQIDHLKYELGREQEMFENKRRECENLQIQKENCEYEQKRLEEENDQLMQRVINLESDKARDFGLLKQSLNDEAAYQFENLKSAYGTQVGILSEQIAELQGQLSTKSQDYSELFSKCYLLDRTVDPEQTGKQSMYTSRSGVQPTFLKQSKC